MHWSLLPRDPYVFEAFVSMTREVQRAVEHSCYEITHDIEGIYVKHG